MQQIFTEAISLLEKQEPFVVATVVRTQGFTPQKAGAKVLVRQDGSIVGTIGGGCVEGDILVAAKQLLQENRNSLWREYVLNEDLAMRDGLVCGGTMYIFLDVFRSGSNFTPMAKAIVQAYREGPPIAVATVVHSAATATNQGFKLLIREDGSAFGRLGEPDSEENVIKTGQRLAFYGNHETITTDRGTEIFVEGFTIPPLLVLLGGGHISKAVAYLAATLGFRIYVVDDRQEFSNKQRFPEAVATIVADFADSLDQIPVNNNTFILVATRGHKCDDIALEVALRSPARYVGMLGSKRKVMLFFQHVLESGVPPERVKEIHSPVGLNIGALTPEEIAISIMAEIVMCYRGGNGAPLKIEPKF